MSALVTRPPPYGRITVQHRCHSGHPFTPSRPTGPLPGQGPAAVAATNVVTAGTARQGAVRALRPAP